MNQRSHGAQEAVLRSLFMAPAYQLNAEALFGPGGYDVEHFLATGLTSNVSPSFYFDSTFYPSQRPVTPNTPLLIDFLSVGAAAGAQPHPLVDVGYVVANTDTSDGAEVLAYLGSGADRSTRTHPLFWSDYYLESNPDIASRIAHPLNHYLSGGYKRNREPNPFFNSGFLAANSATEATDRAPLLDFLEVGLHTDQTPTPLFDPSHYRRNNDIGTPTPSSAYLHFLTVGLWREADPHPAFDSSWYRAKYGSAVPADMPPTLHYLRHEHLRQHQPSSRFHPAGVDRIRVVDRDHHVYGGRILERYLSGEVTAVFMGAPIELSEAIHAQVARLAEINPAATARVDGAANSTDPLLQNFNTHMTRKTRSLQLIDAADRDQGGLVIITDGYEPNLRSELVRNLLSASLESGTATTLLITERAIAGPPGVPDLPAGAGFVDLAEIGKDLPLSVPDAEAVVAEWLIGRGTTAVIVASSELGAAVLDAYGTALGQLMSLASLMTNDGPKAGRSLAGLIGRLDHVFASDQRLVSSLIDELALTADDSHKLSVVPLDFDQENIDGFDEHAIDRASWFGPTDSHDRPEVVFELAERLPTVRFTVHSEHLPPLSHERVSVSALSSNAATSATGPSWILSTTEVGDPAMAVLCAAVRGCPIVGVPVGPLAGLLDDDTGFPLDPGFTIEEAMAAIERLRSDPAGAEQKAKALADRLRATNDADTSMVSIQSLLAVERPASNFERPSNS